MSIEDPQLMQEFVIESQDHLASVESQLLSLENCLGEVDMPTVNKAFRAVHSIKGAAGFLGLETLATLAHRSEEVLNKLRNNEMQPSKKVVDVLLLSMDKLKGLLDSIETSNQQDVSLLLSSLESLMSSEAESQADCLLTASSIPKAVKEFLIESYEAIEHLERDIVALDAGGDVNELINNLFCNIHTIKGAAGFLAFTEIEQIAHCGESILSVLRNSPYLYSRDISSAVLQMADAIKENLSSIEISGNQNTAGNHRVVEYLQRLNDTLTGGNDNAISLESKPESTSLVIQSGAEHHDESVITVADEKSQHITASNNRSLADSSIRVDVALLDNLMTCVGELVLARNQILQYSTKISSNELAATSQRLNIITSELQEGVMKTRMQQIGTAWSRFPRMVRDLASSCGKEVRVEMEGKETELDKTILEAIKDPLTHLVRNTVDHGIESPQVRRSVGKPAEGSLALRAYHEGGQVNIEISDDGGGLNTEKIRKKAIERGIITPDRASRMNDREIYQLIFLPGFSTADKVSNVSGRGVGMDVVKTNIEKIGGTIDLQSAPGVGTTFRIKIPLTLAIIPALVVAADGNRYAIPQINVVELVCLDYENATQSIETLQGASVYRLRGRLLPVVRLRDILKVSNGENTESGTANIVVLRADDNQFGLVVDRICDTQEIVVKPLSTQLSEVPIYAGATIMGDGKVALILDVLGLAQSAFASTKDRTRSSLEGPSKTSDSSGENQTLLILGTSASNRLALPISQVARLEKIPISAVEQTENQEVVQYRGAILPLVKLASIVGIRDEIQHKDGFMNTVVYTEGGRSYGLVVDKIIDTVETAVEISKPSSRRGMLGSAIISNHVTDLIDIPEVIKQFESQAYTF